MNDTKIFNKPKFEISQKVSFRGLAKLENYPTITGIPIKIPCIIVGIKLANPTIKYGSINTNNIILYNLQPLHMNDNDLVDLEFGPVSEEYLEEIKENENVGEEI